MDDTDTPDIVNEIGDDGGLNSRLLQQLVDRANELIDSGLDEAAVVHAYEDFTSRLDRNSEKIADALSQLMHEHLPERAEWEAGVRDRIGTRYSDALAAYDAVVQVIAHAAREFWARYRSRDDHDALAEVLWGNLAQGIRVAREVGHMLRGGFPYGALAAQRTGYELAVRSMVLRAHANESGHEDLVERYQLHDEIGREADMREYQRTSDAMGFEPMDNAKAEADGQRKTELLERFGKHFGQPYGWAVGLPGVTSGSFKELETLAGVDHRRGIYRWASHYVHGDPSSLRMSIMRRGGVSQGVVSDLTNVHLTDPAQFSLYALNLNYLSLAMGDPPDLADLWVSAGLPHLIDRTSTAFWKAEQGVRAAEDELQGRLRGDP